MHSAFSYIALMSLLLSCIPLLSQNQAGPSLPYDVVRDWPQLPAGWSLGQGSSVAVDSQQRVFALHRGRNPVLCFDRSGKLLRSWGEGMLCRPHGINVDRSDNVWIIDQGTGSWPTPNAIPGRGHVVLKFSPEGKLLMTLGKQGQPGEDAEHFNGPSDIAFALNGDFYVTDGYGNSRVVKFSESGEYLLAWGRRGTAEGEFNLPHAIEVGSDGRVYVADRENLRLQIFDANGRFLAQWSHVGRPIGLALSPEGHLFVADANGQRILKLDTAGAIIGAFGSAGNKAGQLAGVHHIAVGEAEDVYVAELRALRFQRFVKK